MILLDLIIIGRHQYFVNASCVFNRQICPLLDKLYVKIVGVCDDMIGLVDQFLEFLEDSVTVNLIANTAGICLSFAVQRKTFFHC